MTKRIEEASSRHLDLLVLEGGEPTLERELPELVALGAAGARLVALETNATLIDAPLARRLRDAGLGLARIKVSGFTSEDDRLSGDPGGFRRSLAGLEALQRVGIPVELVAALTRSTLGSVSTIPDRLVEVLGPRHGIEGMRVGVPVDAGDRTELVTYPAAVRSLAVLAPKAERAGLPLTLVHGDPMPPCVAPEAAGLLKLFELAPTEERPGFSRLPPCEGCAARSVCPGLADAYLRSRPAHELYPLSKAAQATREERVVAPIFPDRAEVVLREGADRPRHVVRALFHCNQACAFCFVPTYLPPASEAEVLTAIDAAAREGADVVFSGGEPTLHPHLEAHVRAAHERTGRGVGIETNALAFADEPARAQALRDAGLEHASVSLHGACADIADALTRSPGGFARTLEGLDALHGAGIEITIAFVLCRANLAELPPLVRLVAARWPVASVLVSRVEPYSVLVPRTEAFVLSDAERDVAIEAGRAEASRLGVRFLA